MRAEIQIRTNGMDFWATLEHQLRYKQNIEEMDGYEEVSNELLELRPRCDRYGITKCSGSKTRSDNSMIFKKTGEAVTASPVLSHCFHPERPRCHVIMFLEYPINNC